MHCPACFKQLTPEIEFGIELNECTHCGGIWFDEGELRQLRQFGENAVVELDLAVSPSGEKIEIREKNRQCPLCSIYLDRYKYDYSSTIELDSCSECGGIWVDDGELSAMLMYKSQEANQFEADGGKHLAAAAARAQAEGEYMESIQKIRRREAIRHVMHGRYGHKIDVPSYTLP